MKKFARVLALMLVASMLCVMLVACGGSPAAKPEDAKAALEGNGYTATLVETNGTTVVTGVKDEDSVYITYYADQAAADAAYKTLDETYTLMKELADELGEDMGDYVYGQDGTMVWYGTSNGVSAAK